MVDYIDPSTLVITTSDSLVPISKRGGGRPTKWQKVLEHVRDRAIAQSTETDPILVLHDFPVPVSEMLKTKFGDVLKVKNRTVDDKAKPPTAKICQVLYDPEDKGWPEGKQATDNENSNE